MKKGLMLLVAGLMAFGATINAMASARLDSMSTDAREVEDIDLIWLYPNKVLEYKNTVDFRLTNGNFNFGDGTDEWGGVIAEESALGGVLGVYVNRPNELHSAAHSTIDSMDSARDPIRYSWTGVGGDYFDQYLNNVVDIFWAQSIGGADLGVHLNYGNNGQVSSFFEADTMGLGLGLGLGAVGPFSQFNLHADFNTNHVSAGGTKDNGIYSIKLGALGQADLSTDNYARVFADLSVDQDNRTDMFGYNYSDFDALVGASCNHKVNGGKGLISTGLMANYVGSSVKDDFNEDAWNLVWTGSVESEVASWLTLRAGIQKALVARDYWTNNAGDDEYENNARDNVKFSTGFGINWQNFTLDANVEVASLENSIENVNPGNGLFFTDGDNLLTVTSADLRYKF